MRSIRKHWTLGAFFATVGNSQFRHETSFESTGGSAITSVMHSRQTDHDAVILTNSKRPTARVFPPWQTPTEPAFQPFQADPDSQKAARVAIYIPKGPTRSPQPSRQSDTIDAPGRTWPCSDLASTLSDRLAALAHTHNWVVAVMVVHPAA